MLRPLVLAALLSAHILMAPAQAETDVSDAIVTSGRLTDADFYRLATCGARPAGQCLGPALRWDKARLTVRLARGNDPIPPGFEARLMPSIRNAINEVNGVGAGIKLAFTRASNADITIRPTNLAEGSEMPDRPGFSGPGIMGVGYMTVWSDRTNAILEAVILISTTISETDLTSVMLEEVTQSLGFLHDIDNEAYEGVSILSQTSNETTQLTGQDATILRMHYPPKP
ncbi:DUF2927 domain-containing protein [Tabrizicola sp.]|uniref:DUF2927 domain-containing protein n=1 Tax=Tabrizicola sp. TaxID=2005166 RepID=UPI00262E93F5|nr:DUF2927 domain-containing protein [Tabrizicola sp.]MDM7931965.1 DUF2927 domain-containing protein [Tabrizicola sp.]